MKKSVKVMIGMLMIVLLMMGCSNTSSEDEDKSEEKEAQELQIDDKKDDEQQLELEDESEDPNGDEDENAVSAVQKAVIYSPKENADGFVMEESETTEMTPEYLIGQLIEKNVIPSGVEVVSFEETQNDGEKALLLDLSSEFATFLQPMGTTGEYVAIGSICNTFLDTYECEGIQITVEGEVLTTGHAEYPGYLTKFD